MYIQEEFAKDICGSEFVCKQDKNALKYQIRVDGGLNLSPIRINKYAGRLRRINCLFYVLPERDEVLG